MSQDRLQEILLRDNLLTQVDLQRAIDEKAESGGKLRDVLLDMNLLDEETLTKVVSEAFAIPFVNLSEKTPLLEVVKLVPKDFAMKNRIVAIERDDDILTLCMADPQDVFIYDGIKNLTGLRVKAVIGMPSEIEKAIERFYDESVGDDERTETFEEIMGDIEGGDADMELVDEGERKGDGGVEKLQDDAPIIKLTDSIIQQAVKAKASDVFIEPLENALRIRYRVDGIIREVDRLSRHLQFPLVSRIKVVSSLDISEHRVPQDGRFKTVIGGRREVDFRVNVLPTILGEKICLRVLDKEGGVLSVEKLGFEPQSLERLKKAVVKPHGMILTCGPTGSGKTTTLYSILGHVDSPGKNIITVEDPVEYQMKGANQVNVKPHLGLTFAASLRSILRQDPDIIMIGEIRDGETLNIGVKAALTGHLVLSSLHTTTAAGSIVRMINMGIEPFLICSSLLCLIAQRLLRRVCPNCREEYEVDDVMAEKLDVKRFFPEGERRVLYKAKGCDKCFNSGYKGRVGITEILVMSPALKKLIMNDGGEIEIKKVSRIEGMLTMREDGVCKAIKGLTTLEEVARITAPDDPLTEKDIKAYNEKFKGLPAE